MYLYQKFCFLYFDFSDITTLKNHPNDFKEGSVIIGSTGSNGKIIFKKETYNGEMSFSIAGRYMKDTDSKDSSPKFWTGYSNIINFDGR